MTYKNRTLIHVEVGDGTWNPTKTEINDIAADFKKALDVGQDEIGLVATRSGVKFTVTPIEGDTVLDVRAAREDK